MREIACAPEIAHTYTHGPRMLAWSVSQWYQHEIMSNCNEIMSDITILLQRANFYRCVALFVTTKCVTWSTDVGFSASDWSHHNSMSNCQ